MPKRNDIGIGLLADPTRRRIVAALALRPRLPSSLARELDRSRPAISHQLRLLEDAGLVRATGFMSDRRSILYAIEPRAHGQITAWLAGTELVRPTDGPRGPSDLPRHPEHGRLQAPSGGTAAMDRDTGQADRQAGLADRDAGLADRDAGRADRDAGLAD
jgi:DNA-binding transcriptional ArsR family regulator